MVPRLLVLSPEGLPTVVSENISWRKKFVVHSSVDKSVVIFLNLILSIFYTVLIKLL